MMDGSWTMWRWAGEFFACLGIFVLFWMLLVIF